MEETANEGRPNTLMKFLNITKMPDLPFDVAEALNQLRINLGFSGENIKVIMTTSSTPDEGKSFVSMNLWRQMAEIGNTVLYVDCDMRNSELKSRWGFQTEEPLVGIVHYLSGKAELADVVYQTNLENGYLIPVATDIANPVILLESSRFKAMIDWAKTQFDYVILDTPPLGSVADALNIAPYADGSLLIIRSGEVPRKIVENSMNLLKRTDTPLLGVVLNRADTSSKGNGYYYNHYYRYGYGNDYGYGDNKKKSKKKKS